MYLSTHHKYTLIGFYAKISKIDYNNDKNVIIMKNLKLLSDSCPVILNITVSSIDYNR